MSASACNTPYPFLPVLERGKRGGAVQHVQDVVRDAIVRLDFKPGDFIDKNALCTRLGVSRFPVSEALGRLADEGFVEVLPQRGTRITRIDLADCREAMFIRRALEAQVVRHIAKNRGDELVAALEANLLDLRQAMMIDDRLRFHDLDIAFHDSLLDRLGYERVKAAIHAARAKLDRMRLFLCTPERQSSTVAEHEAIVAALRARNPAMAAAAMENHLDAVMEELAAFSARHPDAFEMRNGKTEAA
jgi:DNA-binding GntR family transcriptional regulator